MAELDPVEEAARFWPPSSDEGEETDPCEVSLFIGGKEFILEGVGERGGESVYGQLRIARTQLLAEIEDPEGVGRMLDMTPEATVEFLKARLVTLNWLIENITPPFLGRSSGQDGPEEARYPVPG